MAPKLLSALFLISAVYFYLAEAGNREVNCGACKAIVKELKYAIKNTDQKKTIDIGGNRLRADGSVDGKRSVKYAGSQVHLIELLENICDEMNNYALSEDPATGAKDYVRFNSRAGESVTLNNVRIDSGTMQQLKDACTSFIADFEDDVIDFFTDKEPNIEYKLCYQLAGYCGRSKSEL